jgi:5-methylcytosine-specific restriction endonuclease McrA
MLDHMRCVVLNTTHEYHDTLPVTDALVLVLEEKAFILEEHPEMKIRSVRMSFPVPLKIVLKKYVNRRITKPLLTRKNLYIRDNYTCQYCHRHEKSLRSDEFLTKDHVFPKSLGGSNDWLNLVTCCNTCNGKKGNRTLEEAGMKLRNKPHIPDIKLLWESNYFNN